MFKDAERLARAMDPIGWAKADESQRQEIIQRVQALFEQSVQSNYQGQSASGDLIETVQAENQAQMMARELAMADLSEMIAAQGPENGYDLWKCVAELYPEGSQVVTDLFDKWETILKEYPLREDQSDRFPLQWEELVPDYPEDLLADPRPEDFWGIEEEIVEVWQNLVGNLLRCRAMGYDPKDGRAFAVIATGYETYTTQLTQMEVEFDRLKPEVTLEEMMVEPDKQTNPLFYHAWTALTPEQFQEAVNHEFLLKTLLQTSGEQVQIPTWLKQMVAASKDEESNAKYLESALSM